MISCFILFNNIQYCAIKQQPIHLKMNWAPFWWMESEKKTKIFHRHQQNQRSLCMRTNAIHCNIMLKQVLFNVPNTFYLFWFVFIENITHNSWNEQQDAQRANTNGLHAETNLHISVNQSLTYFIYFFFMLAGCIEFCILAPKKLAITQSDRRRCIHHMQIFVISTDAILYSIELEKKAYKKYDMIIKFQVCNFDIWNNVDKSSILEWKISYWKNTENCIIK